VSQASTHLRKKEPKGGGEVGGRKCVEEPRKLVCRGSQDRERARKNQGIESGVQYKGGIIQRKKQLLREEKKKGKRRNKN